MAADEGSTFCIVGNVFTTWDFLKSVCVVGCVAMRSRRGIEANGITSRFIRSARGDTSKRWSLYCSALSNLEGTTSAASFPENIIWRETDESAEPIDGSDVFGRRAILNADQFNVRQPSPHTILANQT
jgi:hypothetical protein